MPTAILKFKLPEERPEYETCVKAGEYASAIAEIREAIRRRLKYGDPGEAEVKTLEELRGLLPEVW